MPIYGHMVFGSSLSHFLSNPDKIWYNWAKIGPNMGVAAPWAPVGGWGSRPPQKFGHGS